MDRETEPTRREFLLKLARGAAYAAPVVTSFTVAPELLAAQGGSPPGKMMMRMMMWMMRGMRRGPAAPASPIETPTDIHPPPGRK